MNPRIMATLLIAATLLTPILASADESEATFTPQGADVYPAIKPSQVVVYVYKPDFKFKII